MARGARRRAKNGREREGSGGGVTLLLACEWFLPQSNPIVGAWAVHSICVRRRRAVYAS